MEEDNKYWLDKEKRICTFCKYGEDNWEHFVKECIIAKEWLKELGENEEKRLNRIWNDELDKEKGYVLRKFWWKKEEPKTNRYKL